MLSPASDEIYDLSMLFANDSELCSYFLSLPDEVRIQINKCASCIHSSKQLKHFADRCLQSFSIVSAFDLEKR